MQMYELPDCSDFMQLVSFLFVLIDPIEGIPFIFNYMQLLVCLRWFKQVLSARNDNNAQEGEQINQNVGHHT